MSAEEMSSLQYIYSLLDEEPGVACIHDTLHKFKVHNFRVHIDVCDGATTNLTALKVLMGIKGSFGISTLQDRHEVPTTCINLFKIFPYICMREFSSGVNRRITSEVRIPCTCDVIFFT